MARGRGEDSQSVGHARHTHKDEPRSCNKAIGTLATPWHQRGLYMRAAPVISEHLTAGHARQITSEHARFLLRAPVSPMRRCPGNTGCGANARLPAGQ